MGRVRVFFGQREITQNCFVHFVGQAANAKHELALKDQGWVVAPLSPGMNFISRMAARPSTVYRWKRAALASKSIARARPTLAKWFSR
jgi:hypothetical protein